jgi:tetratricopeptide (TPR) repeat protein
VSGPAALTPAFDPATLVGTVLDGRYQLEAHLASGGMGAVFRARHVHLVRVTDFGRSQEGLLFLVMDLLTGESLFEVLRRERILPPPRAVSLLWQMCSGLEAAHQHGVVHRDLKPENVFLARTASGREVVKLLDFGIAKFARAQGDSATQTGVVVGTPEYLSPEQAMGLPVDARADVYTVGLIAFRMLTGHHPFRADDARGLLLQQASAPVPPLADANPELHAWPALCAAVAEACEKDPADRPPSAAALGQLLAAALGPAFVLPPGATPPLSASSGAGRTLAFAGPAGGRGRRRRRIRWIVLGAAVAIAAAAAGALVAVNAWRTRPLARAQALLGAGKPDQALAALDAALSASPNQTHLLLLRARALWRMPGRQDDALEAYAAVQARGPLEPEDYQNLAKLLGAERRVADRAARVLREAPPVAVAALTAAARTGSATQRVRAMTLLRDLGAEDAVDRVSVYGALLSDPDCDIRRAAARRLGELGDSSAIPVLRAAAAATRVEKRWNLLPVKVPACGSAEATEALRRIQSAN